jgi:hypothetical protein
MAMELGIGNRIALLGARLIGLGFKRERRRAEDSGSGADPGGDAHDEWAIDQILLHESK